MTNGDIKSVQGDTGHVEAEMVMDVLKFMSDEQNRQQLQAMLSL